GLIAEAVKDLPADEANKDDE
ncbi:MAG: ribosome-binding factor A, partial [Acinetobacter sp.]